MSALSPHLGGPDPAPSPARAEPVGLVVAPESDRPPQVVWWEELIRPLKTPLSRVVGSSMIRTGIGVTASTARRSCVVLAPHPDDETLGCGVTIMRKVDAGTPVQVVVVSDGSTYPPHKTAADNIATRHAELRASCAVLGLGDDAITHLAFPETKLHLVGEDLVDAVSDVVRASRPDDVLVTSEFDPHSDHAALGAATLRALSGTSVRVCVYPIWQWDRPRSWIRTLKGASRPERVATTGYIERKRRALACYTSQLTVSAGGELAEDVGLTPKVINRFVGSFEAFFPCPLPDRLDSLSMRRRSEELRARGVVRAARTPKTA